VSLVTKAEQDQEVFNADEALSKNNANEGGLDWRLEESGAQLYEQSRSTFDNKVIPKLIQLQLNQPYVDRKASPMGIKI